MEQHTSPSGQLTFWARPEPTYVEGRERYGD